MSDEIKLNDDGLEPGQPVDFETMQRVNRARKEARSDASEQPAKRGRKAKQPAANNDGAAD